MNDCAECSELRSTYVLLAGAVRAAAEPGEHPSSHEIASLVVAPERLDPAERLRIAAHLRACPACTEDADATRRAERALGPGPRRGPAQLVRDLGAVLRPALAALLVLTILGYPAYQGLVKLPGAREEVQSLRQANQSLRQVQHTGEGPVLLHVLEEPLRAQSAPRVVAIGPERHVLLAVLPTVDEATPGDVVFVFQILDEGGQAVWSTDIDARQLRQHLQASGVATVRVPTRVLAPGRYRVRLASQPPGQWVLLQGLPLEIVGPQ
jgi:hypothetical protein